MEVTESVFKEVLDTYEFGVHEAPIVKAPHKDQKAGFGDRTGEALGFVKQIGEIEWHGDKFLAVTNAVASSPEHEQELVRLLSGPMKYNSPEVFKGGQILAEVYGTEKTKTWPEDKKDKHYLRRINLCGDTPIAQFGMPQAYVLADGDDPYYQILLTDSKGKKTCPDCGYKVSSKAKYCSHCGETMPEDKPKKLADDSAANVSAAEFAKVQAELEKIQNQLKLADEEKLKAKADAEKLETEKKENDSRALRLEAELKRRGDELDSIRRRERKREIEAEVEKMIAAGTLPTSKKETAIMLAEVVEEKFGRDTKIMLAEGKELLSADAVLEALSLPEAIVAQQLRVLGTKPRPKASDADEGLTLSERQENAIQAAVKEHGLKDTNPDDLDKAYAYAARKNPVLFSKVAGASEREE